MSVHEPPVMPVLPTGAVIDRWADLFLGELYRLGEGNERAAIQHAYTFLHAARMRGDHDACVAVLATADVSRLSPATLASMLTITAPLKAKLGDARAAFFVAGRERIIAVRGQEAAAEILAGLE